MQSLSKLLRLEAESSEASRAFLIDLKFTQKKTQKIDCDCGTVCVREKVYGREREEPEKR